MKQDKNVLLIACQVVWFVLALPFIVVYVAVTHINAYYRDFIRLYKRKLKNKDVF